MLTRKITSGYVIQYYDGPNCVAQEFEEGDEVFYEDHQGESIDEPEGQIFHNFNMEQPFNDCNR